MSLLYEIQTSVMQEANSDVGHVLLKLRFLSSRLGSDLLEEWIKYELDGYPEGIPVPDYRKIGVSYTGTFSGAFGSGLKNAPIPLASIRKYAGERWVTYEMRNGIAEVDDLVRSSKHDNGGTIQINASDLILLLQGKIYREMACNSITGLLSVSELAALQFSVRSRVLELTFEFEKKIPDASEITIETPLTAHFQKTSKPTTDIVHQTIYTNNYTVISNSGTGTQSISVSNIRKGDIDDFKNALIEGGIPKADVSELAKIVSNEEPQSKDSPFGSRAKSWIEENLRKSATGGWQISKEIAIRLMTEAAIRYHFN